MTEENLEKGKRLAERKKELMNVLEHFEDEKNAISIAIRDPKMTQGIKCYLSFFLSDNDIYAIRDIIGNTLRRSLCEVEKEFAAL